MPGWSWRVLGHSQIAVTMNVYGHVMDSQLRDAADEDDEQ
jgi:integrase